MALFSSALKSFTSNISSNYSIASQPSSTSGPWKIYDAKKKSTGKPASVFVFDKKSLDSNGGGSLGGRTNAASLKRAHEEVLERLKKEASSLARLRHPSILELAEPVEETRSGGLMFATEPVTASLASLLRDKENQERSGGPGGRSSRYVVEEADGKGRRRRELEIDELEIQKGLLQIGKGLEFLHESAGLVHCNLTPEAIFVNAKSDWKISGLAFSSPPENSTKATSVAPISLSEVLNHDPRLPRTVQLDIDYTSPDFVLDNNISVAADMFSLGLLITALYNSPNHRSPLETHQSVSSYKRLFASSSSIPTPSNNFLTSSTLPRPLQYELLPRLITRRPAQRLNAREFQQAGYFDNILVSTIRFLDSLPTKTPNEKSQFMRGLPRILAQFPKSVLEKKVLPALLEEMKDKELLAVVLQNVFKIISTIPSGRRAFVEKVIPRLREVFLSGGGAKGERDSAKEAGLMVLLENIQLMADNSNGKEFKDDVLPLICLALDSPTHSLVDAGLRTLPVILYVLDFSTIKNELFPIIANVFAKTTSMGIKIRGLQAFQVLCGGTPPGQDDATGDGLNGLNGEEKQKKQNPAVLDKYTIQEKVVPLLKAIKTKEPAVMMAALEVFKEVGKIADSDFLAMDVLPLLWHFSLGPLLNLPQFQAFMTLIKQLSTRIETEQTRKLQELSASNPPTATSGDMFLTFGGGPTNGATSATGGDEDFEALVLGKGKNASNDMFDAGWGTGSRTASPAPNTSTSFNSRPSNSRTQSAATFSWSTPPPPQPSTTSPPPRAAPATVARSGSMATLTPQATGGRAITPDHNFSNFAVLQPQQTGGSTTSAGAAQPSAFSLPLQPSRGGQTGMGMGMAALTPTAASASASAASTPGFAAPTQASGGIDWTAASRAVNTQNALHALGQSRQTTQFAPQAGSPYSGFSIAPPPLSPQGGAAAAGAWGAASGGGGIGGGAGAGAGAGGGWGVNQGQAQAQGQAQGRGGQKKGLDQWESLL